MAVDYKSGTDFRHGGFYKIPPSIALPAGETLRDFISVTTALETVTDFTYPLLWWIAEYVRDLAELGRMRKPARVWHPLKKEMVEVPPGRIFFNDLSEEFGAPNWAMHHIKEAGFRRLMQRGNRGQIVHDAIADWAQGVRITDAELYDYVATLLSEREYPLRPEYCQRYVRNALIWLNRYVRNVRLSEVPVLNFADCYAGCLDLDIDIQPDTPVMVAGNLGDPADREIIRADDAGVDYILDAKCSKAPQLSHLAQVGGGYLDCTHTYLRGKTSIEPVDFRGRQVANLYIQPESAILMSWTAGPKGPKRIECGRAMFRAAMLLHRLNAWEADLAPEELVDLSIRRLKASASLLEKKDTQHATTAI